MALAMGYSILMRWFTLRALLGVMLLLMPVHAAACSLALVLALDESHSVDAVDYRLQRKGLEAAFRDPLIGNLIEQLDGGALVAVTQWSDAISQRVPIGWTHLQTRDDATAFAGLIDHMSKMDGGPRTATGDALLHAARLHQNLPITCARHVIDINTDGKANNGSKTSAAADAVAQLGITINGLAISRNTVGLERWLRQNVVRGPGAFVIHTDSFFRYADAIRRKLMLEFSLMFVEFEGEKPVFRLADWVD